MYHHESGIIAIIPQRWKIIASAMENYCLSDGIEFPSLKHNPQKASYALHDIREFGIRKSL